MITVAIAIAMGSNPGVAVASAAPLCARPTVRHCRIACEVTNVHAAWMALTLALDRLDGRSARIVTNQTPLLRETPYWSGGGYAPDYHDEANRALRRIQQTGCEIVHTRTKNPLVKSPEAEAVRWLHAQATKELWRWINDE